MLLKVVPSLFSPDGGVLAAVPIPFPLEAPSFQMTVGEHEQSCSSVLPFEENLGRSDWMEPGGKSCVVVPSMVPLAPQAPPKLCLRLGLREPRITALNTAVRVILVGVSLPLYRRDSERQVWSDVRSSNIAEAKQG